MQEYDIGPLTMTCRTCGKIKIKTQNNNKIIPSLSFGIQKQFSKKFSFTVSAGIQYLELSSVIWETSNNYDYPNYVHNKIDSIVENSSKNIETYGNIIPTLNLSMNFIF